MSGKNCHKCGLPLAFKKLPSGKWCPTNPDGSDHWDICRETTRGVILKETAWEEKGYKGEFKTLALTSIGGQEKIGSRGKSVKGVNYDPKLVCECKYDIPPWEDCTECPMR